MCVSNYFRQLKSMDLKKIVGVSPLIADPFEWGGLDHKPVSVTQQHSPLLVLFIDSHRLEYVNQVDLAT